ncbi:2-keto-3-deoxygluconate transporter [Vibrio artabrorum]|uniref:2-keto-3-deoxygluconate transporter n=1 Tax=Vibrio artabrorum TaxID=446374 RepID=UPI00354F0F4F
MHIKRYIDKVPGGMMLVPLFIGALVNTIAPNAGTYFGSFTNGIMHGIVPILSVWFFCIGSSISFKSTGMVLRKSGVLVVTKIAVAWIVAIFATQLLPEGGITTGLFAGFSVLTLVAAMDMTNGGLYASLMDQYGTKEDAGAFVLMSVESGPLMTMMILGTTGMASFHLQAFIGTIIPFAAGLILGNLDKDLKEFFSKGVALLIPFFGFSLGCGINIGVLADTGIAGIILSLFVIVITGIPLIIADIYLGKGNGTAGIAASSTAGAAVATPILIAQMAPQFKEIAPLASALVAASTLLTSILVPIATAKYSKWVSNRTNKFQQKIANHV